MNHGKRSVVGQLTQVENNRLTISDTVSKDEPAGEYMKTMEYRKSPRGCNEAEGKPNISLFRDAHRNGG